VSGQENQSVVPVRVIQSIKGMNNIYANMLRNNLGSDWKVLKSNGDWSIKDNSLYTNSPGNVNSVMVYANVEAKTARSSTQNFRYSVDIKGSSNYSWAGPVFHAKDEKTYYFVGLQFTNPLK